MYAEQSRHLNPVSHDSHVEVKLGLQYDDRLPFRSFRIVPFGHLMFKLFTNYHLLVQ